MMKTNRISATTLLLSFCLLFSCDKSDEKGPNLTGTWKLTQSESSDGDVATDNGEKVGGTFAWCTTITFKSDGTFEVFRTSDNFKLGAGTYAYSNGMLITTFTGSSGTTRPATINGNTMVINNTSATASCSSNDTYQKI
ncbi:MAG TPA: lipocalin family protein [Sphingobacteriaceae bacterium]